MRGGRECCHYTHASHCYNLHSSIFHLSMPLASLGHDGDQSRSQCPLRDENLASVPAAAAKLHGGRCRDILVWFALIAWSDMEAVSFSDSKAPHILVVDDDPATRRMVTRFFEEHDIPASSAGGRHDFGRQLQLNEPSLILVDLRLGREDGLDLLRQIRSNSDVPVIITTGHRLEEIDRVVGLELGADDYVTKPFGLRELLARVRAVLRRHELGGLARAREPQRGGYKFGGWQLERDNRRLTSPNGVAVTLTKGEYALLVAFLEAPQRPLTREQLLHATRVHEDIFDRSIDVQVLRLRRKLESHASAPRIIRTERGIGYIFALPVEQF